MVVKLNHGNRLRPPGEAYERKKLRSRETYAKLKLASNPFWLNEKILRKNYNLYGGTLIEAKVLSDEGFDFKLVNNRKSIEGETVFIMNKFGYSINHTKKIKVWKFS
jgi:hypothetical protein